MLSDKSKLRNHVKAVHENVKIKKRPECDFTTFYLGVLNRHMKVIHATQEQEMSPQGNMLNDDQCFV
jgi:hypothetical protein